MIVSSITLKYVVEIAHLFPAHVMYCQAAISFEIFAGSLNNYLKFHIFAGLEDIEVYCRGNSFE